MEIFVWPGAVVLIVIFAIILFRKPIASKIGGISRVDGKKIEFGQASVQQEQSGKLLIEELSRDFNSTLLKEREAYVVKVIDINQIKDLDERCRLLIKYIAISDIMSEFDNLYYTIYGSQLDILNYLNSNTTSKENLKTLFYDPVVLQYPSFYRSYSFEQYFDFLNSRKLLYKHPDNSFSITVLGREFLSYLIKKGYSFDKGY